MTTGQIINWTVGSDQREALVFAPSIEGQGEKGSTSLGTAGLIQIGS